MEDLILPSNVTRCNVYSVFILILVAAILLGQKRSTYIVHPPIHLTDLEPTSTSN